MRHSVRLALAALPALLLQRKPRLVPDDGYRCSGALVCDQLLSLSFDPYAPTARWQGFALLHMQY